MVRFFPLKCILFSTESMHRDFFSFLLKCLLKYGQKPWNLKVLKWNERQVTLVYNFERVFNPVLTLWARMNTCLHLENQERSHPHPSFLWSTIAACVLQSLRLMIANTKPIWGIAIARWWVWQICTCLWWNHATVLLTGPARLSLYRRTFRIPASLNLLEGRVGLFKTD